MKWFCPYCWKEVKQEDKVCPFCKKDLTEFQNLSFEDKLLLALKHPVRHSRMVAIETLGRIKSKKAVSPLCKKLTSENGDTYELIEVAKALINIEDEKGLECVRNFLKTCQNKVIKGVIEKLLNA
ncbi:MAG: HEAT repeat domain-containing protein [Thermodesulfobacteria bacterium]|nr:HEAT repeat domain-containing protein [Thermodesulfobacteriota bacterium]